MKVVSIITILALPLLWLSSASAHVRITTKVTWDREIAPIVQARCVSCHREGGKAPMALTTYDEARPWAKAIKEEVLTRRMPKWHVVRGYGDFANDPSLSGFEIALIASWADGGAPETLPSSAGARGNSTTPDLPASAEATARSRRSASRVGGKVGPPRDRNRTTTRSCAARTIPVGFLVGITPVLEKGSDLRVDVGGEPLLWLKDFDPAFAETYWLRNPVRVARGTTIRIEPASAGCSIALLYAR